MFDKHELIILDTLQSNGRASTQDLSDAAGLSPSPCWRRVRKLEQEGVITGYVATLNAKKLDLLAFAYIRISLNDHGDKTIQTFTQFVKNNRQVIECASVAGDSDFVIKVVARNPEGLEDFVMRKILRLGVVRNASTTFILRQIKTAAALPLDLSDEGDFTG